VYTIERVVSGFTLDPSLCEFLLSYGNREPVAAKKTKKTETINR